MVQSSSVFEKARYQVKNQFSLSSDELSMPLFKPFNFSEGDAKGQAAFFLCKEGGNCFHVQATKDRAGWSINSVTIR